MIAVVFGLLSLVVGLASSTGSPSVIIVGAGISGIGAAVDLLNKNFSNVVILEATSTVGGRIRTVQDGEGFLEYGAEWIMGEEGNVVHEVASAVNIVGSALEENLIFCFTSTGERISQQQVFKYWEDYDKILELVRSRSESVDQVFRQEVLSSTYHYGDKQSTVLTMFKMLFESITPVTRWENEVGAGFNSYQLLNGSTAISVRGGMGRVLEKLMVSRVTKLV